MQWWCTLWHSAYQNIPDEVFTMRHWLGIYSNMLRTKEKSRHLHATRYNENSEVWINVLYVLPEIWTDIGELIQEKKYKTHLICPRNVESIQFKTFQMYWNLQYVTTLTLIGTWGCQSTSSWPQNLNVMSYVRKKMPSGTNVPCDR